MFNKNKGYDPNVWVSPTVVCEHLDISYRHLCRLRQDKTLIKGKHYKSVGRKMAMRATYRYHLNNIVRDIGNYK